MTARQEPRLEWRDPQELAPNPLNWRTHPDLQRSALREAMARVGWAGVILVNERTGNLIDGHARLEEALAQGIKSVPTLIGDWSEEEERFILLSLDPIGAMAGADRANLEALLRDVMPTLQDEPGIGTLLEQIARDNKLLPPSTEGLTDPDDAPPLPAEPVTKPGDLWLLGDHRLLCGDSTDADVVVRLMDGADARLMVTDPPYGVNLGGHGHPSWSQDHRPIANDNLGEATPAFWTAAIESWPLEGDAYFFAPSGPPVMVLGPAIEAAGIEFHQMLVWVKDRLVLGRSHYHYRHEHILYGWKGKSSYNGSRTEASVWDADRPSRSEEHPTMKPVALVERAMINSSLPGDVVVDPFLGSGTALIAAERALLARHMARVNERLALPVVGPDEDLKGPLWT